MKKLLMIIAACCVAASIVEAKTKLPENSDDRVVCYELNRRKFSASRYRFASLEKQPDRRMTSASL